MAISKHEKDALRSLIRDKLEVKGADLFENEEGFAITRAYYDECGHGLDSELRKLDEQDRIEYRDNHQGLILITPGQRVLEEIIEWKRKDNVLFTGSAPATSDLVVTVTGDSPNMSNEDFASELLDLFNENEVGA